MGRFWGIAAAAGLTVLASCNSPLEEFSGPTETPSGDPSSDEEGDREVESDCLAAGSLGPGNHLARSVVVQNDGRILIAGDSMRADSSDFFLVRLTADADLDPSFGSNGVQILNVRGYEKGGALALQPDGKILLAGTVDAYAGEDFAVLRLDSSGELDTSFGEDGVASTSLLGWDLVSDVALQPDGKILVAGYSSTPVMPADWNFALARFNSDGTLDSGFGDGGTALNSIGPGRDYGNEVRLLDDGKILIAGASESESEDLFGFTVVRYLPDGSLDEAFGDGGVALAPLASGSRWGAALDLRSDGRIMVSGHQREGDLGGQFAALRLTTTGDIDLSFGASGFVQTPVGNRGDRALQAALQPDGKLLVVGSSETDSGTAPAIARFEESGGLDSSFARGGARIVDGGNEVHDVALNAEGRIVLVGYSGDGTEGSIFLARLAPDGTVELSCSAR